VEAVLVFLTAGSEEEEARLSEALLDQRLVACVNRVSPLHSEYWWKGARENAEEVLLLAKTRRELWPRVLEAIRAVHSYEVFAAIAVPILESNPDYLRWIYDSTSDPC
jgi:periplasmic divalent cation tolerance protein